MVRCFLDPEEFTSVNPRVGCTPWELVDSLNALVSDLVSVASECNGFLSLWDALGQGQQRLKHLILLGHLSQEFLS